MIGPPAASSFFETSPTVNRTQTGLPFAGHAARTALDTLMARPFTEEEWARNRSRLLEFVNILRSWDRAGKRDERGETIMSRKEEL